MIKYKKIKHLIQNYQATSDPLILDHIKNELSLFIYSYPVKSYHQDTDTASDFLIEILEKLPHILQKYKESSASFYTWFLIVLRNHFFNFMKNRSRQSVKTVPLIKETENRAFDISDIIQFRKWQETDKENSEFYNNFSDFLNRHLTETQKKVITVLFSELDPRWFKGRQLLLKEYIQARRKITEKRNRLLFRMQNLYNQISRTDTTDSFKLRSKKKSLIRCEESLNKMQMNIPYTLAGKILGISVQNIKNTMSRIRTEIHLFFERSEHHAAS